MAKADQKKAEENKWLCPQCKIEFTGPNQCPECGNKTNIRQASDGLDQDLHKTVTVFGSAEQLRSHGDVPDAEIAMAAKTAMLQQEELNDNMRQAYVIRSEIKRKELELEKLKKDAQLNEAKKSYEATGTVPAQNNPTTPGGPGYQYQPQNDYGAFGANGANPFGFMNLNPQVLFMNQLMKMDTEKRKEFLAGLSEADPQALQNMAAMLAPTTPMMPQGANMYGMPPWMMQQQMMQMMMQQQQHAPQQTQQADPTETALNLVGTIMEFMKQNQPNTDSGLKEQLRDLKDEIKELRSKGDDTGSGVAAHLQPIISKLNDLEGKVAESSSNRRTLADSVREVQELVTGLQTAGFITKPGDATKTVDDELKLKQFEHQRTLEEKKLALEEKKAEAEKGRADLAKSVMAGLLNRQFVKSIRAQGEPGEPGPVKRVTIQPTGSVIQPKPRQIIDTVNTEGGTVHETRAPVKKNRAEAE